MQVILFVLYFIYFSAALYVLNRSHFIRRSALSKQMVIALFSLQVAAGAFLSWVFLTQAEGNSDYWYLHGESLLETELLLKDPAGFIREFFAPRYATGYGNPFSSSGSFWNDLASNLIVKILAILNIFSRGNYFINNLLLNVPAFYAHVALYRMFCGLYGQKNKMILAGSFLIPSTLCFTSGTHKDLFVFSALCFFFYSFYLLAYQRISSRRIMALILSLLTLLMVRNYMMIIILPAIAIFLTHRWMKISLPLSVGIVLIAAAGVMLISPMVFSGRSVLGTIVQKRSDFQSARPARTALPDFQLQPTMRSFFENAPSALNHALLRPYPWETRNLFHLAGALELYLFLAAGLIQLVRKKKIRPGEFELMLMAFSFIGLLLIGYIVPNYGSILRYRALYYPFLLTPLFMSIHTLSNKYINLKNI